MRVEYVHSIQATIKGVTPAGRRALPGTTVRYSELLLTRLAAEQYIENEYARCPPPDFAIRSWIKEVPPPPEGWTF